MIKIRELVEKIRKMINQRACSSIECFKVLDNLIKNQKTKMKLYPITTALLCLCFLNTFTAAGSNPIHFTGDISVSCGLSRTFAARDGREWIGDLHPKFSSLLQIKGSSTTSAVIHKFNSADDPVPYKTARLSRSQFSYAFQLSAGQKIVRLHFNSVPYKGFKRIMDLFTVEAGRFTLLSNFSASLTADALGVNSFVKEFYVLIEENQQFDIVFSPAISQSLLLDTYAFINGIEIISQSASLSYFYGGDIGVQLVGKSLVYVDNSTTLEVIRRLNIKRDFGDISRPLDMDPKLKASKINNITWKTSVGVGFKYLIRLHFSEVGVKMAEIGGINFKVCINKKIVYSDVDIVRGRDDVKSVPWYRDYMVLMKGHKQEGKRDLVICLQSDDEFMEGYGPLKGFEILKLSNPDNSLASPHPLPTARVSSYPTMQKLHQVLGHRNMVATMAITLLALANVIIHLLRHFWEISGTEEENMPSARAERLCRRFSFAEIRSATKDFSDANLIGRGGFGKVYKGQIDNGQENVAVKRLKSSSNQGAREFLTEIETLTELRHVNLVSLIGYCNERGEMILVYEYITCGTLYDHLYKPARCNDNFSSLTWKQRLTICIGAGRGLDYLHTGHSLIHRDVKASNILLDENFIPKVSDFGLAKNLSRSKLQSHVTTRVKGTFGYLDPNYLKTGKLTWKSDTYAFGVVLLEVLSGRRALDRMAAEDEWILTKWALEKISNGKANEIVASSLMGEISEDSLMAFVGIAESCLHDDPKKRPTMAQVVEQLEFALEQQESSKSTIPKGLTSDVDAVHSSDDKSNSKVSSGQLTMAFADMETNSKVVYTKPPSAKSRLIPWDVFWKKVKPSGRSKETVKLTQTKQQFSRSLKIFSLIINKPEDLAFLEKEDGLASLEIIGRGGSGEVFKGVLPGSHGKEIAIKKIIQPSRDAEDLTEEDSMLLAKKMRQIESEIQTVGQLRHRNLLPLLAHLSTHDSHYLVYEYMKNGNLQDYLQFVSEGRRELDWLARYKIALGVAEGLEYLHTSLTPHIIHRGIKPSNIILNGEMEARITEFGLAKAVPDANAHVTTSNVVGTIGYIAPEYYQTLKFTDKCDVYSFGVVLGTLIMGKLPLDEFFQHTVEMSMVKWMRNVMTSELPKRAIDSKLLGNGYEQQMLQVLNVACLCTLDDPKKRPTSKDARVMLSQIRH